MLDLIGIGECMVELYADQPLGAATTLHKAYGGDVLNSLVTAQRLGSRTGFVSQVGNDPFGAGLVAQWQLEGIDTNHAPIVDGENGVCFISLNNGEREFTYRRTGSAASRLAPEHILAQYIGSSRMLLLSGITQAISQSAQAATLHAAKLAKQHGVLVAYDPNHRPKLWAARGGDAVTALLELLPFCDVVLPSFPADAAAFGAGDTPERAVRFFAKFVPLVALKTGADGAMLFENEVQNIPAKPVINVVDTTGAGDAWNGAFLHALLEQQSSADAARLAHSVAAGKLAFRGAIAPRLRGDIAPRLRGDIAPQTLETV
jgi:2-dehydro-3-deoxygluconokinase